MADSWTSLLKNKTFVLVWLSGMTVMLGFSFFFMSVSWFVVDEMQQPAILGVVMMTIAIPRVTMMIYGGVLADKIQKSRIMFTTNALQVVVMIVLVVLVQQDALQTTSLIILAFVFGFLDAFFFPAASAMIPSIVPVHQLQQANSWYQGSTELMFIIGPVGAGLLLTFGGFAFAFSAAAGLIALSTILIYPPFLKDPVPEARSGRHTAWMDLKEGLAYVRGSGIHRSGTMVIITINLLMIGPLLISIPMLISALGGAPWQLSLLEGGFSTGTFLLSVVLVTWSLKQRRGRWVLSALGVSFFLLLVFSQVEALPVLVIVITLMGGAGMLVYLPTITMIQEKTDNNKLGRVMSLVNFASSGFEPIAFALISFLVAASIPIQTVLMYTSVTGSVLTGLLLWLSPEFRQTD